MMLWASVLSSKQYVKMPMHDVLSNLVMLKAHHEASTPALTRRKLYTCVCIVAALVY